MSFDGQRYLTRGILAEIPFDIQMFMWYLISELDEPKDYLQVFRLTSFNGTQHIVHEQEDPQYNAEYDVQIEAPVTAKVYVIDDGDHSTMLLAEEY